ncbi:hypothetical protein EVAR_6809_1 [Eumeta japonica]|uniref:Uncharacterized protein n=1 Tax=Eumeta variegata TaxID=151549 RepID=A0A4C1U6Y0_EUMVA|nr:hypothetical protein EVAR_6809_1 [Eumeta japonica]
MRARVTRNCTLSSTSVFVNTPNAAPRLMRAPRATYENRCLRSKPQKFAKATAALAYADKYMLTRLAPPPLSSHAATPAGGVRRPIRIRTDSRQTVRIAKIAKCPRAARPCNNSAAP